MYEVAGIQGWFRNQTENVGWKLEDAAISILFISSACLLSILTGQKEAQGPYVPALSLYAAVHHPFTLFFSDNNYF